MNRLTQTYVINLPDKDDWKIQRLSSSMKQHNVKIDYKIWNGVIVRDTPEIYEWAISNKLIKRSPNPKYGNIGAALAHITLWNKIAKHTEKKAIFFIMEDNALMTPDTLEGIDIITKLQFDFLNARVLRPQGNITQISNMLKIKQKYVSEPIPNVWLSSYFVTPIGCEKLLSQIKKKQFDMSKTIIDRGVSIILHSSDINGYIIKDDKYFGHVETKNDTRRKENLS